MAHDCDECGKSFETLSRLRLHDCNGGQSERIATEIGTETSSPAPTEAVTVATDDLDTLLDRATDSDVSTLLETVSAFESALSAALETNSGETFRDVFWPYHERVSDALDAATQATGWDLCTTLITTYDPTAGDEIPLVTPTIANAVGRQIIRTRVTAGVEAIPVVALEYLDTIAVTAAETADTAREEVHAYGWGIGHPEHSVADRLHARTSNDVFSVAPTLEHAFYADQHAAIDVLELLVRDESIDGTLSRITRSEMPYRRYLLDCVYGLKTDDYWPQMPRYFDWHTELAYTFELDDAVDRRIQTLVEETGFDDDLPDEWTFRDLGI